MLLNSRSHDARGKAKKYIRGQNRVWCSRFDTLFIRRARLIRTRILRRGESRRHGRADDDATESGSSQIQFAGYARRRISRRLFSPEYAERAKLPLRSCRPPFSSGDCEKGAIEFRAAFRAFRSRALAIRMSR